LDMRVQTLKRSAASGMKAALPISGKEMSNGWPSLHSDGGRAVMLALGTGMEPGWNRNGTGKCGSRRTGVAASVWFLRE
jgi:hypothetical protein